MAAKKAALAAQAPARSSSATKTRKSTARTSGKTGTRKASSRTSSAKSRRGSSAGSSGRRKSSSAKTAGKRPAAREAEPVDYAVYYEVVLWVVIAVSVLMMISLFGFGGIAGRAVRGFLSGVFGVLAFVFPVLLVFSAALLIANYGSARSRITVLGCWILHLVACSFCLLGSYGYEPSYRLSDYYQISRTVPLGGGAAGAIIPYVLCPVIGEIGCGVILVIAGFISLVLISHKALLSMLGRGSTQLARKARDSHRKRREWAKAKEAVRSRKREEEEEALEKENQNPENLPVTFSILPKESSSSRYSGRRHVPVPRLTPKKDSEIPVREIVPMGGFSAAPAFDGAQAEPEPDAGKAAAEPQAMKKLRTSARKKPSDEGIAAISLDDLQIGGSNVRPAAQNPEGTQKPEKKTRQSPLPKASDLRGLEPVTDADDQDDQDISENGAQQAPQEKKAPAKKTQASLDEIQEGIADVESQISQKKAEPQKKYVAPPLSLMEKPKASRGTSEQELRETAAKLAQVLSTFGVNVKITNVTCGPSVTRYELIPEMGVKVSKIVNLQNDIKLNLAAEEIRIEAPIPGKSAIGIEVPNKTSTGVLLRELLESKEFQEHPSSVAYAVGKDIAGNTIVSDIARMPHLLIAGSTGSGKSVFINTLITSIIYKASPEEVKLILIDPKVVELKVYNGIPHLYIPVVTDPKKASGALNWAVAEMTARYNRFSEVGVRDIRGYNKRVDSLPADTPDKPEKMPRIVIIVDELADLMMVASTDVESAICRLAQLARAAGIHLVVATQRPSVDVITGLIKANMPSRIAFSVSSGVDSRTILDMNGAERLLGNGDMLFAPQTFKQPLRVQGAFISDSEVAAIAQFLKDNNGGEGYNAQMEEHLESVEKSSAGTGDGQETDELFADAGKFIIEKDKASIGMLQRWFRIGFNRAARIMDQLSDAGVVGPDEGTKPRKVLMSMEQFENYLEGN